MIVAIDLGEIKNEDLSDDALSDDVLLDETDDTIEDLDNFLEDINNSEKEIVDGLENKQIKFYLNHYFKNKLIYFGGPIPENELHCEKHYEIMKYINFEKCITVFMDTLQNHGWAEVDSYNLFKQLQDEMKYFGYNKYITGGLLVIYLTLCLGLELYISEALLS